jgi:pimeloyl-ACP methyl ester carboxylesterase
MVHGFSSTWEAWANYLGPQGYLASVGMHGFAVGDGQVKGMMNTGNLANPTGRTNTIAENAAILGQYIEAVKKQTGAQKVDLLVHSLGGLIARYYIDRLMPKGEVVNLLILGSPMTGTGCANLPAALGFYLPAVLEFQPSYVQDIFNPQITQRGGVIFSALAGVPLVNPLQSPCTPVPSDIAVSLESVNGIPMEVSEMPILHTELNTSPDVFSQFVLPHLQTPPGEFATVSDPPVQFTNTEPMQFTRIYSGHIDPGGMQQVTINIDADVSVASFALFDSSHSLTVEVTGASGKVLTLDPVTNGLIQVDDPSSLIYLGYGFNHPKPGAWNVKLVPTGKTPDAGADYALTAVFQGGATLSAQASVMTPALHEPVQLTAHLELNGSPLDIHQATAFIRSADGSLHEIDMGKTTDTGTVQATWKPTQPGLSGIEIRVRALAPDDTTIERSGFLTVEVQPGSDKTVTGMFLVVGGLVAISLSMAWLFRKFRQKKPPARVTFMPF